jgi:phosphoribosylamine---glycine ligase
MWVREPELEDRGKGLIDRTDDPLWGSIIVADCTGLGGLCDMYREHGAKVAFGSALMDKLEGDREYSQQVFDFCNISTPFQQQFSDWDSAISFIKSTKDRLVFKPEGSMSGNVPSFVAKDNEELLSSIEHFKALVGSAQPEFTLQQYIDGTCLSTEGYFDGQQFIGFVHTIERKHFMEGDIGPSGGCVGNLVWPAHREDPVVEHTVLALEGFLRERSYIGTIDINAVINEEGIWALEFTPRFGYDAFPTTLLALYTGEFGDFLYRMASSAGGTLDVAERFGAGVRLTIPPWPSEKFGTPNRYIHVSAEQGVQVGNLKEDHLIDRFYPYDIKLEDDMLVTSGGYGVLGVMNAYGDSIDEAFDRAYRRVRRIQVPDLQYRKDLGEVCKSDYRKLARVMEHVS